MFDGAHEELMNGNLKVKKIKGAPEMTKTHLIK